MDESFPTDEYFFKVGLSESARRFSGPYDFNPKHHTIREGHNIKVGDTISFRVWSGKPYASKQIIIAPDVQIVKTWQFDFIFHVGWYQQILNGIERESVELTKQIATNDGLTLHDFLDWFNPTPNKKSIFSGQIICWNPKVEY